jgi:3-oxoacyl-[acyl-carrier protein] reductase
VAPGFIKTDMTQEFNEDELKAMIPANRFGEAEEVADLVAFLASKKTLQEKSLILTEEFIHNNLTIYQCTRPSKYCYIARLIHC